MFKIDDEVASPNEGARLRLWGTGIAKRGGVFKMLNRHRYMRGRI